MIELSTHPVFDGERLVPRHVDLRAFVFSGDERRGGSGGPEPGRAGGQHGRQLLARRRLEGHLAAR